MSRPDITHTSGTLDESGNRDPQAPLLRVYTLGAFHLAWQVAPFTTQDLWKSRTSARSLFKLLLCAPDRQASRSLLAGILWPEADEDRARESLRSASKVLRKVLRAANGEELLETCNNNTVLKLAEQSSLWVDADAFEKIVAQASRATAPEETQALWQQANTLLRGEFLADDQGSEWMPHRWIKMRQQALRLARGRMVRHLSDLYLQQGQYSLAEEVLEQHLVRFPTDQDALYRLLALLEQQGSFDEARLLYERTRRTLEMLGKQPAPHVRARYERLQETVLSWSGVPSLQHSTVSGAQARLPVTSAASQGLSQRASEDKEGVLLRTAGDTPCLPELEGTDGGSWDALRLLFTKVHQDGSDRSVISQSHLFELGIAALISRLAQLDRKRITTLDREEVGLVLSRGIADGWILFLTQANAEILALSQLQLSLLHQVHPLLSPATRSYLYAGAYGLMGLALHQQQRYEQALHTYHHAHLAALATGDPWYVAQSLICQADTYLVLGRYHEALHAVEEALLGLGESDEAHRRARAHLLGCWADIEMTMGSYSFAQGKLDESAQYLDEHTLVEEFDRTCWLQLAGKKALMEGKYQQAVDSLEEALAVSPSHWLVRQAGILTPLAMAYARLQERDRSLFIAEQAIPIITSVNAPMANAYFLEYLQRDVLGRFPRDNRVRAFLGETQRQLPHLPALVEAP